MHNSEKMGATKYFLTEVLSKSFPLEDRKREMKRLGSKLCQGFPEWSDMFGVTMKPIDEISTYELKELLEAYREEEGNAL